MMENVFETVCGHLRSSCRFELKSPEMLRVGVKKDTESVESAYTSWHREVVAHKEFKGMSSCDRIE